MEETSPCCTHSTYPCWGFPDGRSRDQTLPGLTSLLANTLSKVSSVWAVRWMLDTLLESSGAKLTSKASLPCSSHRLQSHSSKAFPLPRCRWLRCFLYDRRPGTSRSWGTHTPLHLQQHRGDTGQGNGSTHRQLGLIHSLPMSSVRVMRKTRTQGWGAAGMTGLAPGRQGKAAPRLRAQLLSPWPRETGELEQDTMEQPCLISEGLVMEEEEKGKLCCWNSIESRSSK